MSLGERVNLPTSAQMEEQNELFAARNALNSAQNELLSAQNELLSGILGSMSTSGARDFFAASWDYVADLITSNTIRNSFNVGDCLLANHDIFGPLYWRLLGFNSGDIYDTNYRGDCLVETMVFTARSGFRNDFDLRYKRYKFSTEYTTPLDGDVTEVRIIETSGSSFSYNAQSGALTFGVALPKNTIGYVIGKVNGVEYRTTIFGDGSTTSFTIQVSVEGTDSPLGSITQLTFVADEWEYDDETGIIHIGAENYNMPFGDSVEVDVRTTKPSIALQTVQSLSTTFQFDKDNVNFYPICNARQFLNTFGTKAKWFQKMSATDTAPDWATTQDGFLEGLDRGFLKHVKKCRKLTCIPNNMKSAYNNASSMYTTEQFFLLSLYEVNAGNNNGIAEGSIYDYYDQFTGADLNAARIKKVGTNAQTWWLRSPNVSSSSNAYYITSSGTTDYTSAYYSCGLAPACIIG